MSVECTCLVDMEACLVALVVDASDSRVFIIYFRLHFEITLESFFRLSRLCFHRSSFINVRATCRSFVCGWRDSTYNIDFRKAARRRSPHTRIGKPSGYCYGSAC